MGLVLAPIQQFFFLSAASVSIGCVAWRLWLAPRAAASVPADIAAALGRIAERVAGLGLLAALTLVAAWVLRMVAQVAAFRDPFVPLWEDISFLLFETFWGTVWMVQGVLLVLLAIAFWRARAAGPTPAPREVPPVWWIAAALALAMVTTLALSSHAMGVERGRPWFVAADALHGLTAGTWIGSLAVILAVGRVGAGGGTDVAAFAAQIRSFSPLALASGIALVTMGSLLSWTHVQSWANLVGTPYGRILAAKVGLAGVVFAAGFWNWRWGLSDCDHPHGAATLRGRAAGEVFMALGVLLLTAVLVNSPKPGE